MTSSRPYLLRALYEWIMDNGLTPYMLVDALYEGVEVPGQHIQEGKIVLNVSPSAVDGLELGNDWVLFNARFGGVDTRIFIPEQAVLAIYASETGKGMSFDVEVPDATTAPVAKVDQLDQSVEVDFSEVEPPHLVAVESSENSPKTKKKNSRKRNKTTLRIVK
jgi:stringent starvation protein B